MKTKVNIKISWSSKELKELVANEHSRVYSEQIKKHISLHPIHLNNINKALHEILDESINFYDPELKGYILSYTNPELLDTVGLILYDTPFIHVNIQAIFYIFKPEIGCKLSGSVNKRAKNHIGVLVHKIFNVWIPKPEDEDSWEGKDLEFGQNVEFTVTQVNVKGKLPDIRGKLIPGQVHKKSQKSTSTTKSEKNQHTTFDSDEEEEENVSEAKHSTETQKKVVTSTPKPGNSHLMFDENSDSSSDEDLPLPQSVKSTKKVKTLVNGDSQKMQFPSPSKSEESEDNDCAEGPGDDSIRRKLKERDISASPERETEAWPQEMIDSPRKSRLLEAGVLTQVESSKSKAEKASNKSKKQTIFSYETSSDDDVSSDDNVGETKFEPPIKREKTHSSHKKSSTKQSIFTAENSYSSSDEEQTKSKKLNKKTAQTPRKINSPTSGNNLDDNRVTDKKINREETSQKKKNTSVQFEDNSEISKKAVQTNPPSGSDTSSDEDYASTKKLNQPKRSLFPERKKLISDDGSDGARIKKEFSPTKTASLARQLCPSSSDDSSDEDNSTGGKLKSISAVKNHQSTSANDKSSRLKIKKELITEKATSRLGKIKPSSSSDDSDEDNPISRKLKQKKPIPAAKKHQSSSSDDNSSGLKIKKELITEKATLRAGKINPPSSSDDSSDEDNSTGGKLKSISAVKNHQSTSANDKSSRLKIKKELITEKATHRPGKINPSSSSDDSDDDNPTSRKLKEKKSIPAAKKNQSGSSDDNSNRLKIKKELLSEKAPSRVGKIHPSSSSDDNSDNDAVSTKLIRQTATATLKANIRIKQEKPSSGDSSDEEADNSQKSSSKSPVNRKLPVTRIKQEPGTTVSAKQHVFAVPEVPEEPKKSPKKTKNKNSRLSEGSADESSDSASKKSKKRKSEQVFEDVRVKQPPLSDVEQSPKSKRKSFEETRKKRSLSLQMERDSTDSSDIETSNKKKKSKVVNNHTESSSIENQDSDKHKKSPKKSKKVVGSPKSNGNVSSTLLNSFEASADEHDESITTTPSSENSGKSKKKKMGSNFFSSIRIKQEPVSDDEVNLKSRRKKSPEDANSSIKQEQPLIKSEQKLLKRKLTDNNVKMEPNASDVEGAPAKKKIRPIFSE